LKHFAANSQEHLRFSSDSIMDERTLREMYLTGFEMAVKEAKPKAVMCAYNQINGEYCSDSYRLLTEILREEWGFEGMVVTDWGAMSDRIKGFQAGCDLSMPGGAAYMEREALEAVKAGKLSEADIDTCVERILRLIEKSEKISRKPVDMEANHALARRVAEESAVLLKNENHLLPLTEKKDVVWIGYMAEEIRYQGSGSSHINPWKMSNIVDIYPEIPYVQGCDVYGQTNEAMLTEAVSAAKKAKVAVVFAGLTDQYESEGFDRENMKMPEGHVKLIEAVAEANPNTVAVLFAGSPVEMEWADKVKSILYMGLPGQAGAEAAVSLLFGKAVPCGKLAETWAYKYEDCISSSYYVKGKKDAYYKEGIYVGYRYYSSVKKPVRYPFGHGLSYTTFAYSDLRIEGNKVFCTVTNTGNTSGKEIVQIYIAPPKGEFYRPALELKGFRKISLRPDEAKEVSFELNERSFAIWNEGWIVPGGNYRIYIGGGSEDLMLAGCIEKEKNRANAPKVPQWYFTLKGEPSHQDFEKLVGHEVTEKPI
ncbi:MAG: glycoside hydrolase family 3 C-terminal domain-containing protein, partial [Lachnospiraceae bacterium]|nr:glycoside hydrolase family 3 C-terminal domain-containing protein [Lachnospiraceae bacterium]